MFMTDTIAAISTAIGYGSIGIVRISGDRAIEIGDILFRSPSGKTLIDSPSHRIHYGIVVDPETNEYIDEVLIVVMKSPRSYTREDVVEINCHGGPVSLQRILKTVIDTGARTAEPGEFTKRAFLNGRIDLSQAEAVLDIINARTELAQKAAREQLEGRLSQVIERLREELITIAAHIEAYIDFPEEDIDFSAYEEIQKKAQEITEQIQCLIDNAQEGRIIREGIKTAIIGRPNVGKSSLLNILSGQDRAIVTDIPGTTRDVIEECINIQGIPFCIIDTAGIRHSSCIIESEGINRSRKAMDEADLVLLILDSSMPLDHDDKDLLGLSAHKKVIVVLNKIDLTQALDHDEIPSEQYIVVSVSATKGTGLKSLHEEMIKSVLKEKINRDHMLVTNVRHVKALERTQAALERFMTSFKDNSPTEFLALELREALDALGEILGPTTPEDILDRIFSTFCIGK
jgi:tRNA modification GTPase